jgi:hypothetical protein
MLNFAGVKRLWAWFAGGLVAIAGLFLLAAPAIAAPTSTTGEIQGGKYSVDVAGTKIELQQDNTKATLTPDPGGIDPKISDGKVVISNVKPGTYTVKLAFTLTKDACDKTWFTRLTAALSPLLSAWCARYGVGDTYYQSAKTFTGVVVTANNVTYLEGSDATTARVMGTASEVNSDGSPVIDCSGKGIIMTWIICPTLEFMFGTLDFMYENLIKPFLAVTPLTVTDTAGKETELYTVWNNIRNIANIAFILVFFVIIFSQATSAGISNYGIKRLLPRLILVVVATNLSYFICAILVDLFNILGAGAASLVVTTVLNGQPSIDLGGLGSLSDMTQIQVVLGSAVLLAPAIIFGILIFMLFALLVFLMAAVILIFRQALLIFLIIVAPLAFVAGLLPNTQGMFRQWGNLFLRLLAMYPLIVLLFAAGKIASTILSRVGGLAG